MDTPPNIPLLDILSDDVIAALVAKGQERAFADGQTIHVRGGGRPSLSLIMQGRVRFGVFSETGNYIQAGLLKAGHCFGEATLFANRPRAYHADAVGETIIIDIAKPQFELFLQENAALAHALLVTLTSRLYDALDFADDIRSLPIAARIVKQLLRIRQSGGFTGPVVPVRQSDLAYALGLSRVSVGKALQSLQEAGLVELGYGEIRLPDPDGLTAWLIQRNG